MMIGTKAKNLQMAHELGYNVLGGLVFTKSERAKWAFRLSPFKLIMRSNELTFEDQVDFAHGLFDSLVPKSLSDIDNLWASMSNAGGCPSLLVQRYVDFKSKGSVVVEGGLSLVSEVGGEVAREYSLTGDDLLISGIALSLKKLKGVFGDNFILEFGITGARTLYLLQVKVVNNDYLKYRCLPTELSQFNPFQIYHGVVSEQATILSTSYFSMLFNEVFEIKSCPYLVSRVRDNVIGLKDVRQALSYIKALHGADGVSPLTCYTLTMDGYASAKEALGALGVLIWAAENKPELLSNIEFPDYMDQDVVGLMVDGAFAVYQSENTPVDFNFKVLDQGLESVRQNLRVMYSLIFRGFSCKISLMCEGKVDFEQLAENGLKTIIVASMLNRVDYLVPERGAPRAGRRNVYISTASDIETLLSDSCLHYDVTMKAPYIELANHLSKVRTLSIENNSIGSHLLYLARRYGTKIL